MLTYGLNVEKDEIIMTKLTNTNKNVIETMAELVNTPNMNLGVDEIEFPDGTKEKFYFNGEEDRQAAINFAQICFNATNDTVKAKQMMDTCFALLTKSITPTGQTVLGDGITYYIDHKRKLLCDKYGNIVVELEDDEKEIFNDIRRQDIKLAITRLLQERAEVKIWTDLEGAYIPYNEDDEW
jgi:hypothetical protein